MDYCKNIKESVLKFGDVGCLARWVKIADIKDHLNLKDTLTEKRKELVYTKVKQLAGKKL